jgi:hypothetical protein
MRLPKKKIEKTRPKVEEPSSPFVQLGNAHHKSLQLSGAMVSWRRASSHNKELASLMLLAIGACGNGFAMTKAGEGNMLGHAPWIKPSASDWENPRNVQATSAKCRAQCVLIADCYYITYITGGDRRGECWLAPKEEDGSALLQEACGMACESFKKTRQKPGVTAQLNKDLQADLTKKINIQQADDDAAPQATWSLLVFQVQVRWKGGLSTFSASDMILNLIREGLADTLGVSKVHVAQMDITEWDDRFMIDYHIKVHKSEKSRVMNTLSSPQIGEKVFGSLQEKDPQTLQGLDFTVVDALSTLTISSVQKGGAIAEPDGTVDMKLILSVFAVVSLFAVIAAQMQSGEKGIQELSIGIAKRNRSFAEQEMSPIGF